MASNILVEKAKEQNIQILQFRNQKLSEQLANLRQQIASLDGSVSKHEEEKKAYADTLLCVNRVWQQFNADVAALAQRVGAAAAGPSPASASGEPGGPPAAGEASAAAGDAGDTSAAAAEAGAGGGGGGGGEGSKDAWERFDPFLRRLLALSEPGATHKAVKRNAQDYQADLSGVEQQLHARASASLQALAGLLGLIQAREAAQAAAHAQLAQAGGDEALRAANQQLHGELAALQQRLDAAHALQRTTQALLQQSEDRAFEAGESLKSIRNDLADKEYALQAAQRKLQRAKQAGVAEAGGGGPGAAQQSGSLLGAASQELPGGTGPPAAAAAAAAAGGAPAASEAEAAAAQLAELQAQAGQLAELLEQRTAEKQAADEALLKAQRELADARAHGADEAAVPQSSLYQLAQRQLAEASAQLEARAKALAALQRDKDELLRHLEHKAQAAEVEKVLRSKVHHLQQQVDELNAKQVELLSQKQALQVSHQQELARFGHPKTAAELQAMVAALQKEVATHACNARKAAEASAAADAARAEALSARGALSAAQAMARRLRERLCAKASELAGLSGKEAELQERLVDLNAFVEVLTTFTADPRELAEVRRSEAALKATVQELEGKLQGESLQQQLAAATERVASLSQQAEASAAEAAELAGSVSSLQEQVAALQGEVAKKQAESEAFAQEIGEAYSAYEEQRGQNSRLLEQLGERDAALAAAQAERLGLEQQLARLGEQLSASRAELAALRGEVAALGALKEATEKDAARVSGELAAAREQLLAHAATLERLRAELQAAQDGAAAGAALLGKERSAGAALLKAAEGDAATLAEERGRRQRLEDAHKLLTGKLERLSRGAGSSEEVAELEEEVRLLRNMLNCNVCHTRQKDVILTKCWHMFCKPCITKNLEARHRKCPGCGHPFGAADVKQFYFT